MRKLGIAAALATLLAFAGGVSTASAAHRRAATEITLYAPAVQFKLIDLGDPGLSLGDQSVFSDDLLTERGGATVGFDGGVCSVVRVAAATTQSGRLQCVVTYSLARGQITTTGLVTLADGRLSGTEVAAITGGTGRYRGASGEAEVEFLSPIEVNVTLSIRRRGR
jgi:allene oxide cyclase-like protein